MSADGLWASPSWSYDKFEVRVRSTAVCRIRLGKIIMTCGIVFLVSGR